MSDQKTRLTSDEKRALINEVKTCRCGRSIRVCKGVESDWMHVSDREERCADGELAEPRKS